MVRILKTLDFTIPMFGNKRSMVYGTLLVTDGTTEKKVKIKDDGSKQYFTFNRKRFYVKRCGRLYSSYWELC